MGHYANEEDYAREFECYATDEEKEHWATQDATADAMYAEYMTEKGYEQMCRDGREDY